MDIFGPQNKQGKSNWINDLNRKRPQKVSKSTDDMRRHQLGSDPIFSMSKIETSYFEDTFLNFRTIKYTQWRTKKNGLNTLQATRQKRDYSTFVGFFPRDFFLTSTFVDGLPGDYPLDMRWLGCVPEGFNIHQIGSPWIREVDACMGFTEDQELEITLYTAIYNEGGGF